MMASNANQNVQIAFFNQHNHRQTELCAYNNLCILQIGICDVTLAHKGIKYQCSFFSVSRNGPALLSIPDCQRFQLLSINCNITEADNNKRQVNEQSKQEMFKMIKKPVVICICTIHLIPYLLSNL